MMGRDERYAYMMMWLPEKWVPHAVIELLCGIQQDDERLWGHFRSWGLRARRPRVVQRPGEVYRHAFETYLQQEQLLPMRVAAARLGMSEASFDEVVARLDGADRLGMQIKSWEEQERPRRRAARAHGLPRARQG